MAVLPPRMAPSRVIAPPSVSSLASLHPTVLAGLLSGVLPSQGRAIGALSPPQIQQLAQSAAAMAPAVATAIKAPTPENNDAVDRIAASMPYGTLATAVASALVATGEYAKWGMSGAMNPISAIQRRKPQPVKLLPTTVNVNASGVGNLTFTPQEPFEAFRLCIPSTNGAGFINQFTAGDRLMQVQSGRMPFNCFRENSDAGRIDFPLISLGETMVTSVTGATANAEISAVLMGYATRPRILPAGAEILYERVLPFDVTTVANAATGTITLNPQRHVIIRRIVIDDSVANFSTGPVYLTSLNVQDSPQFVQNAEIPFQLFGELAIDDWLDFDMCQLGGTITMGWRNGGANATVIQGYAIVDVVRMPGESRR